MLLPDGSAVRSRLDLLGSTESPKYLLQMRSLAAAGDARITLLNSGFEQMVPLVPDLAAETDLERHVARLRNIGVA